MHPDLVNLLDLQENDITLREVDARLAAILGEIGTLDRHLAEAEKDLERLRGAATEALKKRQESESKLDNVKRLIDRQQGRTDHLHGQREIQAAMVEMDLAKSVLAKEEDDWAKAGDSFIAQELALKAAERKLADLGQSQQQAREEIEVRRSAVGQERAKAAGAREESAAQVNKALRHRYDRLRSAKSSPVVVALAGAACGACFTTVPLNRRSQIRAGSLIDWCESCGVILYFEEASVG
jgi:hypothetical protein